MLEPEIKRPDTLPYFRMLRALKKLDEPLYELVVAKTNPAMHQVLMEKMQIERPELYAKIVKIIEAAERGEETFVNSPPVNVKRAAYETADLLIKEYDCAEGFREAKPEIVTVTVKLKVSELVVGLPNSVIALSDNLAREYQTMRKWTFGFDNRQFVADVSWDALDAMLRDPNVEDVVIEPMANICAIPDYNPSAPNVDWGVSRVAPQNAWAKGLYGERVKICVIDTGIKSDHPAFWVDDETCFKGGWNFVSGYEDPKDDHDHGTYCCSIVAHRHTDVGGSYRGVAPNCDLYACKVLDAKGSGSFANIAAAVDWARTNGMDVISMSLGGTSGSDVLKQACDNAWYAGVLVVAAAGNSGPGDNTVNYPAKYTSVIAVAAVDVNENVANFSSRGPEVELSAPGVAISGAFAGNTYHDLVVPGSDFLYMTANGTSAACPHVAAAAGLIKQWYRLADPRMLREYLRDYARDL